MSEVKQCRSQFRRKKSLRLLRNQIAIALVIYFICGIITWRIGEIFPVFSWSLFSAVPQKDQERFTIIIHEQNGKVLDQPLPFNRAPESIVLKGKDMVTVFLFRKLGEAYVEKDKATFSSLQALLESNYLVGEVKYELVVEKFNPIDKIKTGETSFKHLEFFVSSSKQ